MNPEKQARLIEAALEYREGSGEADSRNYRITKELEYLRLEAGQTTSWFDRSTVNDTVIGVRVKRVEGKESVLPSYKNSYVLEVGMCAPDGELDTSDPTFSSFDWASIHFDDDIPSRKSPSIWVGEDIEAIFGTSEWNEVEFTVQRAHIENINRE